MVTLLAQNNSVIAIDILDLVATIDAHSAYMHAEYVILATPTNYDSELNFFDTSAVEPVINEALLVNPAANIIIKSIIPVGFTAGIRPKKCTNIYFSPEFLREGCDFYDNLYPSRIIVGAEISDEEQV